MHVSFSVNSNTLTAYTYYNVKNQNGKLQSGDFGWDKAIPSSLQEICLQVIAANWEANPILEELNLAENRCILLNVLSTDLPLKLTAKKISSNIYWKRCYLQKWPKLLPDAVCDEFESFNIVKTASRRDSKNSDDGSVKKTTLGLKPRNANGLKTWKECYIEMYVRDYLEKLKPEEYKAEMMKELSDLCSEYVKFLRIDELQCSKNSPNRIPLNSVVSSFGNLSSLSLCFKQKYCNGKFSWNLVRVAMKDVKLLANGLETCNLSHFALTNSDIDDEKVLIVLKALLKHDNLQKLDFSHCRIADKGAIGLCKFLLENEVLEVDLTNNKIGGDGVEALCYAICQPQSKLASLRLKLNPICDRGGAFLVKALTSGARRLESLDLSGCRLTGAGYSFGEMIELNSRLQSLELCNNPLLEETAASMLQGLRYNTNLAKLDLRLCNLPANDEFLIVGKVEQNRKLLKRAKSAKNPLIVEPSTFAIPNQLADQIDNAFKSVNKKSFAEIVARRLLKETD